MTFALSCACMAMVSPDPRSLRPPRSYTAAFRDVARNPIEMDPIGFVESPYKERFGTPRQPVVSALVTGGTVQNCSIHLRPGLGEALQDLTGISHLWVIGYMHLNTGWKTRIKPPRGPKTRRGLFATRAPHRPNQLSLSAVELVHVDLKAARLDVRGLDLLDGTPVLDIKPYVSGYDAFPSATAGWIDQLDEPATSPDRLDYWPPPAHLLRPDSCMHGDTHVTCESDSKAV